MLYPSLCYYAQREVHCEDLHQRHCKRKTIISSQVNGKKHALFLGAHIFPSVKNMCELSHYLLIQGVAGFELNT